jgi:FRG domain-containing protein
LEVPILYPTRANSLSAFLARVDALRRLWGTKSRTWEGEQITRKGEEEVLWFRGQPAIAKLSPKLYRAGYEDADEPEIRAQFQYRTIQLMQSNVPNPDRKWDWYFLMQHYGVPTRLLDWTENPLVALFFAVNDERNDDDTSVWVVDPYWLNHELFDDVVGPMLPDWDEAQAYLKSLEESFMAGDRQVRKSRPAAIDPPHIDRRVAVQASHFVIFGKSRDITRIGHVKAKNCRLAKIVISRGNVRSIRRELEDCGITYSFVFPDLEALGKEIAASWKR